MPNRTLIVVVTAALLAVAFWYVRSEPTDSGDPSMRFEEEPKKALPPTVQRSPPDVFAGTSDRSSSIEESGETNDEKECTVGALVHSSHPVFITERNRLSPLLTQIPEIEAYRGQTRKTLESLAEAGDSLAMHVLGMDFLRDISKSEYADAVDFSQSGRASMVVGGNLTAAQVDLLDQGSRWLYEAALHGRLQSLGELNQIESLRYGGPVRQGLIEADPNLDSKAQAELEWKRSTYINDEVMNRSHPAFRTGLPQIASKVVNQHNFPGDMLQQFEADPILQGIIDDKLETFERDRKNAGLPVPQIPPPAMSNAEMFRAICGDDVEIPVAWQ